MSNTNQRILEALRKIRDEGAIWPDYGICSTVKMISRLSGHCSIAVMELATERVLTQWPLADRTHSGYPVGGYDQFRHEVRDETMWKNPRRLELLHWAIQHLENELCPQS
jgi:hypothetical protein